jgi:hypothetical protein
MRTTRMHDLAISEVCTREAMSSCVRTPLARLREYSNKLARAPGTKFSQSWKSHLPEPSEEPPETVDGVAPCTEVVLYPTYVSRRLVSLFVAPTGNT